MPWYAIRTKPHQERLAHAHLSQVCEETFLPLLKQEKIIRRQQATIVAPLFPGYLFARFDVGVRYRAVKFSRGVLNIVEFGLKPAEVSNAMIEAIRGRMNDGYVRIQPKSLQQGQIVHVKGGPLAGLEAVFLREMADKHRVCLLLNTLSFQVRLTMDIDHIGVAQAL